MIGNRFIATAALVATVAFASVAAAQQSMYRCGNKYQDKPCDDGQKGHVVGTTGTPKPAAPARGGSESPERVAERERADAWGRNVRAQNDARDCVRLRKQLREAKSYPERQRYEHDVQRLGCASAGAGGLNKEKKCADALSDEQRAEACGIYGEANPRKRKR